MSFLSTFATLRDLASVHDQWSEVASHIFYIHGYAVFKQVSQVSQVLKIHGQAHDRLGYLYRSATTNTRDTSGLGCAAEPSVHPSRAGWSCRCTKGIWQSYLHLTLIPTPFSPLRRVHWVLTLLEASPVFLGLNLYDDYFRQPSILEMEGSP